jgi:uncharacterized protein (DUF1330 family)
LSINDHAGGDICAVCHAITPSISAERGPAMRRRDAGHAMLLIAQEEIMKTILKLASATIAGAAIGALAIEAIHAQSKSPAYFVAEIDVTDADIYKTYVERNTSIVNAHGGRFLVRGGKTTAMDGEPPKRVVIIAWENDDKAKAWYTSAAYKEIIPIRDKAAKFRGFIAEGVSP